MTKRNAAAFEVAGHDDLRAREAGAFYFVANSARERVGIIHACPCGCGAAAVLLFFRGKGDGKRPEWDVSGEWPKVTLTPSIGFWGPNTKEQGFHWHGYLRDGVFEEC